MWELEIEDIAIRKTPITSSFSFVSWQWSAHPHEHQSGKAGNRNNISEYSSYQIKKVSSP
jgi:hypothetical protein